MLTPQAKSKRKRLEMLHRHRPGCRFPMIDDMTEEMSDYFDVIGITKVVTNIYRYFYDPSCRVSDGVGFLKSLVKARKKDQRELHKAKRKWYVLLWKEWEIRDEIAKLRTLLGVLAPETYTEEGDLRPVVEESPSSEAVPNEEQGWTNLHPKMVEQYNIAEMETKMLKQHHGDQIDLLKEQQLEVEKLQRQQQTDVQMLLNEFDVQIREHKKRMMRPPEPDDPEFDVQILQTQLGQMQTIQRKQLKSLQLTQHQELLTQQNLHKHETIQRLQGEASRQQASLHNMIVAHSQHEQLCLEHQDQIMEMVDEIQDHQQQTFEDSLAIIENRRVNKIIEPPDQVLKRTQQQLQQLHAKQVEQLETLQNQELVGLNRLHKAIRRNIELQIKYEQQNKPKQIVHTNAIGQQDAQIKKLAKLNEENKELINVIARTIDTELEAPSASADTQGSISGTSKTTSKSEDVLDSVNQVAAFQAKIINLQQQMIHQELPYSTLPKSGDGESNFRSIQETILNQQRRVQQQKFQQMALRSLLEHLFELVTSQKVQEQGTTNPYRQSQLEILEDCREMLAKLSTVHDKQRLRNIILQNLEDEINAYQIAYWKKRQKKDEPIDNLGKSLLTGKLAKGNKKEMHPLQKLLFENQAMQNAHIEHQRKLKEALKKAQALSRPAIEQEIQLRRQQEKLLLSMMKETDELEEEQNEDLGPLDIQQNRIDALEAVQKWMTEIVHLESILVDKAYDQGFLTAITIEIEDLEPLFQQAYTIQEEQIKMVLAQQEELVSGHDKIVKILSPNQLALTEDQLRRQKAQLNQLKRDLQYFFKSFTDPFKTSKRMRMKTSEEDSKNKEFSTDIQNVLDLLQNGLSDLCALLKDKQKQLKESMQKLAQQVLRHKMKFVKLMDNHRHLLAQYQDLHIEPERQMILDLISLHKRLGPCLKIQQQKVNRLMYRLRKSQDQMEEAKDTAVEEEKEKTEISKEKKLKKKGSVLSVSSLHRVTLTGVVSKPSESAMKKIDIVKAMEQGDKIKSDMAERRKSVSRISVYVSEHEMTEEQREIRDRQRLIAELKDKQADVLHQVQIYNKPEIFRRVQTLTYPRGMKPRNHEELALYVTEYREKFKGQPEFCPQKSIEYSTVEDNQKSFYKLFEKSEKLMVEKRESEHELGILNLLKEINKENEEEHHEEAAEKIPKVEKSLSRISMKKKKLLKKMSK